MNKAALVLVTIFMTACGHGGSPTSSVSSSPTPVVPSVPQWPPADAVKTSTFTNVTDYSCSTISGGGVKCFDGSTITLIPTLSSTILNDIVVAQNIVCARVEPNGPAADCTSLSDVTCTAPATQNVTYCWNISDGVVQTIDEGARYSIAPFTDGIKSMTNNAGGICMVWTAYDASGVFDNNYSSCGSTLNVSGWIE